MTLLDSLAFLFSAFFSCLCIVNQITKIKAHVLIKAKKKKCLVGVTRPTLFWVPTLDIFIFYFHVEMTKNNENEALY